MYDIQNIIKIELREILIKIELREILIKIEFP